MKKLSAWLDKKAIEHEVIMMGYNYFYNAPEIKHEAVRITVDPKDSARIFKAVSTYCRRAGYVVFSSYGNMFWHVYMIGRAADIAADNLYNKWQALSVDACEQAIHLRATGAGYTGLSDAEFNDILKGIMNFYGDEYNAAKKNMEAA